MQTYIIEYNDPWDCFDRTTVRADTYEEAWDRINQILKPGSIVFRIYAPVFEGQQLIVSP